MEVTLPKGGERADEEAWVRSDADVMTESWATDAGDSEVLTENCQVSIE